MNIEKLITDREAERLAELEEVQATVDRLRKWDVTPEPETQHQTKD